MRRIARLVVLLAALGLVPLSAQEPPPSGAFKTVHLVSLTPAEATTLRSALADINAAVAQAGHPDVKYRLYKVTGKQSGNHNYMWESTWPSGAAYEKAHASPAFQAALKKHPALTTLMENQVYNRYVEVTAANP